MIIFSKLSLKDDYNNQQTCLFSSVFFSFVEMQQPVIKVAPSNSTEVLEGENVTLEWRYNLGGRPLLLMRFTRTVPSRVIVQKLSNTLLIPDSRVQANVTDAFSSISFVGVVRDDDGDYQLEIQNDDVQNNPIAQYDLSLRVLCKYEIF